MGLFGDDDDGVGNFVAFIVFMVGIPLLYVIVFLPFLLMMYFKLVVDSDISWPVVFIPLYIGDVIVVSFLL